MALTMHATSAPMLVRFLKNLSTWLDLGLADAQARGYDESVLLQARLAPDMLPLLRQVQIATDNAKGCIARLAGETPPVYEDTEATVAELKARLQRTIDYVQGMPAERVDGSEQHPIELPLRGREPLKFTGEDYLRSFLLPNFMFHVTTAYAILRHTGVKLGKTDFLA